MNGFSIRDHDKYSVARGADGQPAIKTEGVAFRQHKDAYSAECRATLQ